MIGVQYTTGRADEVVLGRPANIIEGLIGARKPGGEGAMVAWLRSLQKRTMYEGARNLLVAWTFLCALGLIDGLLKILDKLPLTTAQVAVMKAITVGYWLTVWVYPTAGLAIIAFIVRPRAKQSP